MLVEVGDTRLICTASVDDRVPPFLRNTGRGWVTAEYGMLPRATTTRTARERGGTRTAAITGGFVALADCLHGLRAGGKLLVDALRDVVAATSVGLVGGVAVLDLDYAEDSTADVDMNVVMTGAGRFVEVQGTAEQTPFDLAELERLLTLARQGIERLAALQRRALADRGSAVFALP